MMFLHFYQRLPLISIVLWFALLLTIRGCPTSCTASFWEDDSSRTATAKTSSPQQQQQQRKSCGRGALLQLRIGEVTSRTDHGKDVRNYYDHDAVEGVETATSVLDTSETIVSASNCTNATSPTNIRELLFSFKRRGFHYNAMVESLASRWLSVESATALKTIRKIIGSVEEHGVVDIFSKYPPHDVIISVYALSRLQRAAKYYHKKKRRQLEQQQQQKAHQKKFHYQQQRQRRLRNGEEEEEEEEEPLYNELDDPQLLNELHHYAVYANAAYGWKMDLAFRRRLNLGDLQTLLKKTGIERDDVVAASWESRTLCPAFFIARDRRRKTIVLCIRGTWSARDVLTDLCCTAKEFEAPLQLPLLSLRGQIPWKRQIKHYAHHGMLQAALTVSRLAKQVIEDELKSNPDYSLVLVGHSMGGGVAALLGILWRALFPDKIVVYAYGAPCVAPIDTALSVNDIMVNVVSEGDPFSCLSIGHVADTSIALSKLCQDPGLRASILTRTDSRLRDMDDCDLKWCSKTVRNLRKAVSGVQKENKMFPPGRIVFLSSSVSSSFPSFSFLLGRNNIDTDLTYESNGYNNDSIDNKENDDIHDYNNNNNHSCVAVSAHDVPPDFFQELSISPRMFDVTRHVPSMYEDKLQKLMKKC